MLLVLKWGNSARALVIWGPHAGMRPPRLAQPWWNCPLITPGCDLAHLLNMRLSRGPLQLRALSRHLLGSVRRLVPRDTGQGSRHRAPSSRPRAPENLSVTLPGGWWRLGPSHGRGQGRPTPASLPQGRPMSLPIFLPERTPDPVDSPPTGGSCCEWWSHTLRSLWAHVSCGFQKGRLRLILKMHPSASGGPCFCHLYHRCQPGSGLMSSETSHENGRNARNCFCLDKSFLCLRGSIFGFHERVPLTGHTHSLSDTCIFLPLYLVTWSVDARTMSSFSAGVAITQSGCWQTADRRSRMQTKRPSHP